MSKLGQKINKASLFPFSNMMATPRKEASQKNLQILKFSMNVPLFFNSPACRVQNWATRRIFNKKFCELEVTLEMEEKLSKEP